MLKKVIMALILMVFLMGCSSEDVDVTEPEVEAPTTEPITTVEEEVVVPAYEPEVPESEEPVVEEPEVQAPTTFLQDYEDSQYFQKGNPEVGEVVTSMPRKVMIVFNYPVYAGTTIKVYDAVSRKRYDQDRTIIADDDGVVGFTYLDDLEPGTYMVIYTAIFPKKTGNIESEGYYYFEYKPLEIEQQFN